MVNRLFLFLVLLVPVFDLEAQFNGDKTRFICEAELAVRWHDMPFGSCKTDSLGLPSKTTMVSSLLGSDKLVREVLKRNKRPLLSENILQARKRMKITADQKTGSIVVSFGHPDTVFSKSFMDTLVKILPGMYFQEQMELLDKKTKLLDKETDLLNLHLHDNTDALRNKMMYNGTMDITQEKQWITDKIPAIIQERENADITIDLYDVIESGLLKEEAVPGVLLAWAGQLTHDTLLAHQFIRCAKDTAIDLKKNTIEWLQYIKETRKIFLHRMKKQDDLLIHYKYLVDNINKQEPEYRRLQAAISTDEKNLAMLLQRRTELQLYRSFVHLGEIEVLRSAGIR